MSRKKKKKIEERAVDLEIESEINDSQESIDAENVFNLESSEDIELSEDDASDLENLIDAVFDSSENSEEFNISAEVETEVSESLIESVGLNGEEQDSLQTLVGGANLDFSEYEGVEEQGELLSSEENVAAELTYVTDDEAISVLESLLFISDRPVGMTTFKNAFEGTNVTTKKIKELLNELKIDFVQQRRGISLEEVDGAFQLRTKSDNQEFIKKILKPKVFKLTGPSLETLAVIAYKQPCVKSQVDEVRGVESGHLIRALMDKGLVAFDGKSELPGRPMQYKTTRKFLEVFGLRNLSELPSLSEIEELLPEGIGDGEEKETLSELAGKLEESYGDQSYSIGEEELGKITEQLSEISTETEFFEIEKQKQRESRDRDRAEGIREALLLGEAVDPKDEKWLQRYDIKMSEASQETVPADISEKETSELEDLVEKDPLELL